MSRIVDASVAVVRTTHLESSGARVSALAGDTGEASLIANSRATFTTRKRIHPSPHTGGSGIGLDDLRSVKIGSWNDRDVGTSLLGTIKGNAENEFVHSCGINREVNLKTSDRTSAGGKNNSRDGQGQNNCDNRTTLREKCKSSKTNGHKHADTTQATRGGGWGNALNGDDA